MTFFSLQQNTQQKNQQATKKSTKTSRTNGAQGKTHRQAVVKSVLHLQGAGPSAGPAARAAAEAEELVWPDAAACRFEDLKVWKIRISCERVGFVSKRVLIYMIFIIIKF